MAKEEVRQVVIVEDKKDEPTYGMSSASLVQDGDNNDGVVTIEQEPKRKRGPGRPPKDPNSNSNMYTDIVLADDPKKTNKSMEKQIEKGYDVTTKLLYTAINQADLMYGDINQELNNFRTNKSYGGRNRMQHMSDFMNTQVSLINTKVNAIRELNSSRNKINDLILKAKQMMKDQGEENSDKAVMDSYYALINAPRYGLPAFNQALAPSSINTGFNLQGAQLQGTEIITADGDNRPDQSFENYKNNLTPVQKRMIAEKDPNIKTVVVYDQSTGMKYFDVVDVTTGQSIPGIQKPAEFLLDSMRVDLRNGIAVNSNANMSFPLVIIGSRASDEL